LLFLGAGSVIHAAGTQNPKLGTSSWTVATDWKTRHTVSWQHTVWSRMAHGPQTADAMVHTWEVPAGPHRVTVFRNWTGTVSVHSLPLVLVRVMVSVRLTANVAFTKSSTPVGVDETNVQLVWEIAHVTVVPLSYAISRQWSSHGIGAHRLENCSVWKHES
ncbi:MAG: hypothetical protein ACP5QO_13340, partial [Clostridia bacterium]